MHGFEELARLLADPLSRREDEDDASEEGATNGPR